MINAADATAAITTAKDISDDTEITVTLADGTEVSGLPISVNSKGVNLKVDGKVRSFGLSRVVSVIVDGEDEADDDVADMLHDEMTTSELADILNTTPKALRVSLRALDMGVGKGRKYSLSASAYTTVKNHLAEVGAPSAS